MKEGKVQGTEGRLRGGRVRKEPHSAVGKRLALGTRRRAPIEFTPEQAFTKPTIFDN